MITVYKLTKRHVDKKNNMPSKYEQIVTFSTCVGHGVGTIDFSEKICDISDEEYSQMLKESDEYANFKLGNLNKYFEIEIFAEHTCELLKSLPKSKLRDVLENFNEGYLVLRKDFE